MRTLALAIMVAAICEPDYAKMLGEAKISLVDAIDKAIQEAGGTPVGAALEVEHGKTVFEVDLGKDGRQVSVLLTVDGSFESKHEEKHDHTKLIANFNAPLRSMILAAIQRTGGKAVSAEFHGTHEPNATVDTWVEGKLHRTKFDVNGGIVATCEVRPPGFLGVRAANAEGGLRIEEVVKDSPAAKAGLLKGDLITAVDGKAVAHLETLVGLCRHGGAGATIVVDYAREGKAAKVTVTLAKAHGDDDDDDDDDEDDDD